MTAIDPPLSIFARITVEDPLFPSVRPDRLATALAVVVTGTGNRCGHDPATPRWFEPPPQHAARPKILLQLQERVRAYFDDPKVLPSLNAANGSPRQQRSERREACLDLLGALVHYLDLATLRVGIPQADGTLQGLSLAFLAEKAGLGRRRAERACRDLRRAGLVNIHPRAQKTEDGHYRGLPAIRGVPEALFQVFGLSKWLQHERDKAVKRRRRDRRRQETAATAAEQGRRELNLEALRQRAETAAPAVPTETAAMDTARRDTAHAALGALLGKLRGRPPD
ncbi:MAG: replication protein RepA [Gammaproteobacteria bacterium]|nr:replication protein RepA [Gammaproteobacteria bacterium]